MAPLANSSDATKLTSSTSASSDQPPDNDDDAADDDVVVATRSGAAPSNVVDDATPIMAINDASDKLLYCD